MFKIIYIIYLFVNSTYAKPKVPSFLVRLIETFTINFIFSRLYVREIRNSLSYKSLIKSYLFLPV